MGKEIDSFKKEEIFKLIPIKDKLKHKSLILFILSFKRKHNPLSDLIKYKARLYVYGDKQIQEVHYWNTHALVM